MSGKQGKRNGRRFSLPLNNWQIDGQDGLFYNLIRAHVSGPFTHQRLVLGPDLCPLSTQRTAALWLAPVVFYQESHPTLEGNFPLGPLLELEYFCKILTNQYFCEEIGNPLRLLPG